MRMLIAGRGTNVGKMWFCSCFLKEVLLAIQGFGGGGCIATTEIVFGDLVPLPQRGQFLSIAASYVLFLLNRPFFSTLTIVFGRLHGSRLDALKFMCFLICCSKCYWPAHWRCPRQFGDMEMAFLPQYSAMWDINSSLCHFSSDTYSERKFEREVRSYGLAVSLFLQSTNPVILQLTVYQRKHIGYLQFSFNHDSAHLGRSSIFQFIFPCVGTAVHRSCRSNCILLRWSVVCRWTYCKCNHP